MSDSGYNPETEGAKMGFADAMSYNEYLQIDTLLALQKPLSTAHDEMLFIIQHQTSELWLNLIVHELEAARGALKANDTAPVFKMLARVGRIFEQLNNQWDVLRTMTPADYTQFRESLGQSSGFQSHQYRLIEFILGNRNMNMLKPHEHEPNIYQRLQNELLQPSFYNEVVEFLFKNIDGNMDEMPAHQLETPHQSQAEIMERWRRVYEDIDQYWTLYDLAEKLVDLEDYFRRWRFNHVTTVERVIGFKRGTGGTMGVSYLKRMLDVELFPELWQVRGLL